MTTASEEFSNNTLAFKQILKLLDYQLKSLEKVEANANIISVYRKLLKHLRSLKSTQIEAILLSQSASQKQEESSVESDEQILKLNFDALKNIIQSEDSTRKYIEKLSTVRFGMTKSELSRIPNKKQLIEQLMSLINNEKAHQSIKRMAGTGTKD